MADIAHVIGQDIALDATGDFALSSGPDMSRERVLRRLLTNPGDYVWHPRYGAGLPRLVGSPADRPRLTALIRRQMRQERGVSQAVPPSVVVDVQPSGVVTADISYVDAETGQPVTTGLPA